MSDRRRAWMSWSSGKDSALALDTIRRAGDLEVTSLLVTMNAKADRVAMHAARRSLVEAQADRLGLPLTIVDLPSPCSNEDYEERMSTAIERALEDRVEHVIFGDLFLEDVRAYREEHLAGTGIAPLFPLWRRSTHELAKAMIEQGIHAILTCVDPAQLPASFAGRLFDASLFADLPNEADPCGEHGEFHTLVYDCPGFSSPIEVTIGEVLERDGFVFCDVQPA